MRAITPARSATRGWPWPWIPDILRRQTILDQYAYWAAAPRRGSIPSAGRSHAIPGPSNAHVRRAAALATEVPFEQSTSAIQRLFAQAKPRQNQEPDLCFKAAREIYLARQQEIPDFVSPAQIGKSFITYA
jgi:hypothetical protein